MIPRLPGRPPGRSPGRWREGTRPFGLMCLDFAERPRDFVLPGQLTVDPRQPICRQGVGRLTSEKRVDDDSDHANR